MQCIQVQNVAYDVATSTGYQQILTPLTVDITAHRTAIIGANGSGKSTFLRILAGLITPSSGQVRIDPPQSRRGVVFANPEAQLIMPVVEEDLELSLRTIIPDKARRRAHVQDVLTQYSLAHLAQRSVYELSSGEKQRVALAAVLATKPNIILADEPTTVLDLYHSRRFSNVLLQSEAQVIYATHDLDFASEADDVLVFHDGELVQRSQPKAAISFYRDLVS